MERFRYQFFRGYLYRLSTPPHPRRQAPALFFLGNLKFRCCMCHVYKSTTITTTLNRNFSQKYPSFPPKKPSYPLPTTSPSHPALSLSSPLGPPPPLSITFSLSFAEYTTLVLHPSFSLTFLNPFPSPSHFLTPSLKPALIPLTYISRHNQDYLKTIFQHRHSRLPPLDEEKEREREGRIDNNSHLVWGCLKPKKYIIFVTRNPGGFLEYRE